MVKSFNIYFLLLCLLVLQSCKNDFDVIDDYKSTTVVYSLLNFKDSSQYVRVQKSFLGEGNAYLMAQVADSIYQDTNNLVVTLQKYLNGQPVDSFIHFKVITDFKKEEGLFTNFPHIIYKSVDDPLTPQKDDFIDKKASYRLTVNNNSTGQSIYASTPIVKDVTLDLASPLLYPSTSVNLGSDHPFKVDATFPEFGKVMNLTVKFNYTEYTIGTTFFENKTLNYVLDDYVSINERGGQKFTYELSGEKFFAWLKTKIHEDPALTRPAMLCTLDFVFTIGASEFYNYYLVGNNSVLLNDVIPAYTNVNGGLGLVSSKVVSAFRGKRLSEISIDSLANGRFTGNLFN
jgi:hypothetical protein